MKDFQAFGEVSLALERGLLAVPDPVSIHIMKPKPFQDMVPFFKHLTANNSKNKKHKYSCRYRTVNEECNKNLQCHGFQ
jgi:hypothetical protein